VAEQDIGFETSLFDTVKGDSTVPGTVTPTTDIRGRRVWGKQKEQGGAYIRNSNVGFKRQAYCAGLVRWTLLKHYAGVTSCASR
jgi:hypothetical protein